jgi:hypothetical protein
MTGKDGMRDTATYDPTHEARRIMTKAEAANVLHRCGFSEDVIEQLLAGSPDPIDLDHLDPKLVSRYGLTAGQLMERRGASP